MAGKGKGKGVGLVLWPVEIASSVRKDERKY